MTKIMDISSLAGEFREISELKAYADQQYITIQKLQEQNKVLKDEIEHLKGVLGSVVPAQPLVEEIIVTQEEILLEMQIQMIKQRSMDKELTLEETKRLDLLIKNLHLVRGKNPLINVKAKHIKDNISDAQLIEMASIQDITKE